MTSKKRPCEVSIFLVDRGVSKEGILGMGECVSGGLRPDLVPLHGSLPPPSFLCRQTLPFGRMWSGATPTPYRSS